MVEQLPGSGVAQASCCSTKVNLIGIQKLQKTSGDGASNFLGERGGCTRYRGKKNTTPQLVTGRGQGRQSRTEMGGEPAGVRLREEGRRSKVPSDGITLGPIGTWAQVKDSKKGATARGKSRTGSI